LTAATSHLIPPHGGELVQLIAQPERIAELKAHSKEWPSWDLTGRQLCDLELLCGRYAELLPPLTLLIGYWIGTWEGINHGTRSWEDPSNLAPVGR
jgi:hypothetical protein